MGSRRVVRWGLAVACGLAFAAPATAQVSAPEVEGPITSDAVGSGSRDYPFGSTVHDLARRGYVEQEFFYTGHSLVGEYKTRMVVRRPADPAKFSGTVVAEWQNVTNMYDLEALWARSGQHLMRSGDIFVGIDAQAVGINAPKTGLKAWNPERYGSLHVPAAVEQIGSTPADAGMFDIFGQGLEALRAPAGVDPLAGMRPRTLLATGTSQSALYLYLYAMAVDRLHKLADGYLIAEASTSTLGQNGPTSVNLPVAGTRVPVMFINSETDSSFNRSPDVANFRLWEVAGTTHLDRDARDYQEVLVERDFGAPMTALEGCEHPPFSRIPFKYAQDAAYEHLKNWVATGAAPATQPSFDYDAEGLILRDGFENALGGVRLPQFDVPVANDSRENTGRCKALYGRSVPFGAGLLRTLYPTHADYVAKVQAATRTALASGVIVPADAALTIAAAKASPFPMPLPAQTCTRGRLVTLHFPRRARGRAVTRVRVKVAGRRKLVVRDEVLRLPLVGIRTKRVKVRITLALRGGRTIKTVRRFRTCG